MTDGDGAPEEPNAARRRLARHLVGSGIEVGPGRYPFRLLPPESKVRYVDKLDVDDRRRLRDELGHEPEEGCHGSAPVELEPDVIADLDVDRLRAVADGGEDFLIASHVLEHLAEPVGFLDEIHRVLRPGGLAMILLPDRRRTEDRFRDPTPLGHLVAEHRAGVTEVSEAHLVEYLRDRGRPVGRSAAERARTFARYRDQSIHVHCWDADEFAEVLVWGIEHLGHQWELVDACLHEPPIHYEFGYLLRRGDPVVLPSRRAAAFRRQWAAWRDAQLSERPELRPRRVPGRLCRRAAQRARALARRGDLVTRVRRSTYRFRPPLRKARRFLRARLNRGRAARGTMPTAPPRPGG